MSRSALGGESWKPGRRARLDRLARATVEAWALLGGLMLVAVVLMTAASATGNVVLGKPIPGDFELVELGVAVAAFAFLPYCQLTGANVTADIFTANAGPRAIALFSLLGSVIALACAMILLWRMGVGMADYLEYEELKPITGFPIWVVFVPILVSLVLLAVASVVSAFDAVAHARRPPD